ncbi:MAG: hypothetical protein WBO46_15765 [Caldilineaceae bacterium]
MNFFRRKDSSQSKPQNSKAQLLSNDELNNSVHRAKRVLVIGSTKHNGVISTNWNATSYPNVADFDTVVIHTVSLAPELVNARNEIVQIGEIKSSSKWIRLSGNFEKLAVDLLKLLDSGGTIYVIAVPVQRFDIGWGHPHSRQQTNYSWLPFHFEITEEEGETREVLNVRYEEYFTNVTKWKLLFSRSESDRVERWLADHYGKNHLVSLNFEPVAVNRYSRQIATSISYEVFKATYPLDTFFDYRQPAPIAGEQIKSSGQIVVLPALDTANDRDSVDWILEKVLSVPQKTFPPEWVENINVPGLSALQMNIQDKELAIYNLQAEIESLKGEMLKKAELRDLLFESGTRLEELCARVLSDLGALILPPQIAEEDFVLEFNGEQAIVEVKGNTKSVSLSDMSQLGRYREEYALKYGKEIKGVLIANPWRLLPLDERAGSANMAFPTNVKEYAEKRNISLIKTTELFDAFCKALSGEANPVDIVRRIQEGKGETRLF